MSESDDTDELLLMPSPVVDTEILDDNFIPYYQIVDKLITQVSKLKNRITSIENTSDASLCSVSNSIDTLLNMQSSESNNACRRCYSYESIPEYRRNLPQYFSTQSTPQKPRSKLIMKSFPYSPNYEEDLRQFKKQSGGVLKIEEGDTIIDNEIKQQPLIEENNIIREIDDFLSNVKPSTKPEVVRNLDFDNLSEKQNKSLLDVQQILKEMDRQEEKIKYMYDTKTPSNSLSNSDRNDEFKSAVDWKKGFETLSITSTESSLTDKSTVLCGPSLKNGRNTVTNNPEKNSTHLLNENSLMDNKILDQSSLNLAQIINEKYSRECKKNLSNSQHNTHPNAKDALKMHKKLLDETNSPEFNLHYENSKKLKQNSNPNLGSVSLINLWSAGNNVEEQNTDKCIQKLQEEKLRRTHCEELIQQLQNKILEQQEKLVVAIQVDEAKDTAIIKFHDAWEKATLKFRLMVKERDELHNEVEALTEKNKNANQQYEERIEFHRKETNQALILLQEYQSKCENLNRIIGELTFENEKLKSSEEELQNKIGSEIEKNKQISSILANKEIELSESKNILINAKEEVAQCQAAVEMCQKDFSTIKTEYDLIQEEIKNERMNVCQLHEQNKVLHEELEAQRQKEQTFNENLKEAQEKLENAKKEMRNFYQGQVELLVQTKLKEFQTQLDDAEIKMKQELSKKEIEVAKSAAVHIQQINDKYTLEINLIEQKHQEEMQLKQVKIAQLEQRLHEFQSKLEKQTDRKTELVKQLQKVMEAQWKEALRIINIPQDESSNTFDQLQSLHSKSYQNVEAILSNDYEENVKNRHDGMELNHFNYQSEKRSHHKHGDDMNFRSTKNKTTRDDDLQKYINKLIHKQQSNSSETKDKLNFLKFSNENPTSDVWRQYETSQLDKSDLQEYLPHKEANKRRTPWK